MSRKRKRPVEAAVEATTHPIASPWETPASGTDQDTIMVLEQLLESARAGNLHGLAFVGFTMNQLGGMMDASVGFVGDSLRTNRAAAVGGAASLASYVDRKLNPGFHQ
jgi:hypothetical protein